MPPTHTASKGFFWHWIELRPHRIAPVNNQMVLNFIGEKVLGLEKSY